MMSATRSMDMSSTMVEFIRSSWSPGSSFPSAVLPVGKQPAVNHTPADLLPKHSSSHPAPSCCNNPFWVAKQKGKGLGALLPADAHSPCVSMPPNLWPQMLPLSHPAVLSWYTCEPRAQQECSQVLECCRTTERDSQTAYCTSALLAR